ncbi:PAS-domain containing protein [Aureimonas mangrovi]|uniref:PAS domain-containing sensor histidine kinase n=1 Tax=Aureimonas mangrovi TaxID=2758041 RepID=UPI00163DA68B|nr:PAS-domain containing protein [Aureimonas mangrovi]
MVLACLVATPARAQLMDRAMAPETIWTLALLALLLGAAMIAAVWLIRARTAADAQNEQLRAELADARNEAETRSAILSAEGHRVVVYRGQAEPEVAGTLPPELGAPSDQGRFLRFSAWMPAVDAARVTADIERLRRSAEPFRREIEIEPGRPMEVSGRTAGALALVRFSPLGGLREEIAHLRIENERAVATIETLQTLFDAAPMPLWLRGTDGGLVWANAAYARAVEASDVEDAIERRLELFAEQDRAGIDAMLRAQGIFEGQLNAVVEADRRNFAVVDARGTFGSAGLAVDVSAVEAVRLELRETIRSHSETLDHLTTAVARFDEKTLLVYHNAAFARLFGLPDVYLETGPDHIAIMDRLRSGGVLPDDRPLRDVKAEILAAYRAPQATDAIWHLADGRTLRVLANPVPQGGATWVFEDLTEKFELESRLNALVRLQGETLDSLNEAVAVFGQDGRLRLSNPIFCEMWGLSAEFVAAKPHIRAFADTVSVQTRPNAAGTSWASFASAVTAFDEGPRDVEGGEIELSDGRVQTFAVVPLPNGQTMLTFTDISDAKAAERMLRERNEALEAADRVKSDFVQHVNYELRSPLTNIIGFSALLRADETGPLNARQAEYLDYISTSTNTLLTIVNDILDLATIDAGIMDLDLSEVDIAKVAGHAAQAVQERMRDSEVRLLVDVSNAGTSFMADEHRVTQVLFNLLSNAANFAPSGSTVSLRATRLGNEIAFTVTDEGPGIAPQDVAKAFQRFESNPAGGRQSGAGLGLSIVKSFVELHEGSVEIVTPPKGGTVVTCRFPLARQEIDRAAE